MSYNILFYRDKQQMYERNGYNALGRMYPIIGILNRANILTIAVLTKAK